MDKPRTAEAAEMQPAPLCSLLIMSDDAFQHTCLFLPACTLAVVECVTPRMGRVARAVVVELTAARFGITVEPVSGCAWRLLVQEGLAGAGCAGLAARQVHGLLVDPDGRVRSWGYGGNGRLGHGSTADVAAPTQTHDWAPLGANSYLIGCHAWRPHH